MPCGERAHRDERVAVLAARRAAGRRAAEGVVRRTLNERALTKSVFGTKCEAGMTTPFTP